MTARVEAVLPPSRSRQREQSRPLPIFGVIRAILRTRLAWWGLLVIILVVVMAAGASLISPYDPMAQDYNAVRQGPSVAHLLGTDEIGRDVLSRIIFGSRISLLVGLLSVALAAVPGVLIGLVAGYWGGMVDELLMRIVDALYSFPALILALAITAALGPGIGSAMIAIGVVTIAPFARLVRGQALSVREQDYVLAARAVGVKPLQIMTRYIWPNVTAPIIVQASLNVSFAIITEATLSFLGVGVQPPTPSWGSMLYSGYEYLQQAPGISLFPGAAIFVTVLGINFFGDGLREALDPRLRQRGE
jgi:peptide/nickel transport system permease protein